MNPSEPYRTVMKIQESRISQEEKRRGQFEDVEKAAYDAGYVSGRQTGYTQGFQDGFLAYLKNGNGVANSGHEAETDPSERAANGKPLVGPPCLKCGRTYPGSMKHCSRCKTEAETLNNTAA
jgi:hypothetical protein